MYCFKLIYIVTVFMVQMADQAQMNLDYLNFDFPEVLIVWIFLCGSDLWFTYPDYFHDNRLQCFMQNLNNVF